MSYLHYYVCHSIAKLRHLLFQTQNANAVSNCLKSIQSMTSILFIITSPNAQPLYYDHSSPFVFSISFRSSISHQSFKSLLNPSNPTLVFSLTPNLLASQPSPPIHPKIPLNTSSCLNSVSSSFSSKIKLCSPLNNPKNVPRHRNTWGLFSYVYISRAISPGE
jgi:hypothetical protein